MEELCFQPYKKRIIKELGKVPEEQMPKLYKVIHQITTEFISGAKKPVSAVLWKDSGKEAVSKTHCSLRPGKPSFLMNPVEVRMDFITDTHSLVWYFTEDARLSKKAIKSLWRDNQRGHRGCPCCGSCRNYVYIRNGARLLWPFEKPWRWKGIRKLRH